MRPINENDITAALRDALGTPPFLSPKSAQEGRDFLLARAVCIHQIADRLRLLKVAGEAEQLLEIIEKHECRGR